MTVHDVVRPVFVPRPADPVEPPLAPVPPASAQEAPAAVAPLLGRDRPLTADERAFMLGVVGMLVMLYAVIITGLVMAQYVWS